MLSIILEIICLISLTVFGFYICIKDSKEKTEFYKKELDYLDQILKKMR